MNFKRKMRNKTKTDPEIEGSAKQKFYYEQYQKDTLLIK